MSEIFLCETGQLSTRSRSELRKAGIIVVEVADPSKCQFMRSTELVSGDDMLWAALDALKRDYGYGKEGVKQREQFALNIWEIVDAARTDRAKPAPGGAP